MARKIQLSNYFSSDDESSWIPYSAAGDLWNTRYAAVMVFEPIAPQFEKKAMAQVLAAVADASKFLAHGSQSVSDVRPRRISSRH